jgi:nitrite reductase/ring-hydroxylating ferredoxin subunit
VLEVLGESVLVVRTREGALAAHYNVCQHRGSRLVPEDAKGTLGGSIRCPYHSWTYSLDDSLRTAPYLDEEDGFTRSSLALYPVAIESCAGRHRRGVHTAGAGRQFIFASMIRLQREPAGSGVIRVPGGRPVAVALATLGLMVTTISIVLALIPAEDDLNKVLAVTKVAGLTILLVAGGALVYFLGARRRI